MSLCLLLGLLPLLGAAPLGPQTTYVFEQGLDGYTGFADTSLFEESENSGGGSDGIFSGTNGQLQLRRALLRADLSVIPPGSIITGVSLTLTVDMSGANFGAVPFGLHRVIADWGEGGVNGLSGGGFGAPPQPGDATWLSTHFQQSHWSAPGGDYVPAASATVDAGRAGESATWSGPGLVADVQHWLDTPAENFGWEIISDEEGVLRHVKKFASSEAATARPRLVITAAPPPAEVPLHPLAGGGIAVLITFAALRELRRASTAAR